MKEKSLELEARLAEGWTSSRILSLTDNVFAFAMTLLILNFVVPSDLPSENLQQLFVNLWPQFLTYFMSFAVLGTFWVGHHNLFSLIKHTDRKAVWINIIFASFIVLIPLTTAVLRQYYSEQIAVVAYGFNMIICGAAAYWLWSHAVKHKFLKENVDKEMISIMHYRIVVPVSGAIAVTVVGFFSPTVSLFMFAVLFFLVTIPTVSDRVAAAIAQLVTGGK
ncbi:TMEM175 family protein [Patescibacteria group bacterium]|nr:TMEM175 family protein [Patescibacteria group bacterium]